MLHYRRFPLKSSPTGGFAYALSFEGANHIQIGLGFQSRNGLQLTHVKTMDLHHTWAVSALETSFAHDRCGLLTGKLAEFFEDQPAVLLDKSQQEAMIKAVTEVRDEGFGHPLDYEPFEQDIGGGRIIWVAYGSEIDKLRIGLAYRDETGKVHYGEHGYAVGRRQVAEFVRELWTQHGAMLFVGRPLSWPHGLDPFVKGEERRALAVQIVRAADAVWPGVLDGKRA